MTLRDWRAGELNLLFMALVLAVASLSSVGFLADRLGQGLERDARQMIGADFVVRSDHPLEPVFADEARALGLSTARTAIFPSMVGAPRPNAPTRLAAVKAVSPGYPLRGELTLARASGTGPLARGSIPAPGTVWIDPALRDALHLQLGSPLRVGNRTFRVDAVIVHELDRGFSFVNFYPRVMLREDELASTGLIGFGSRVTYRLLVAGNAAAVERFARDARARVDGGRMRGVALESLRDGQPEVRQTLARAHHFLSLVAMLTALLAALAIAMAAQRYMRRHLDACAVMRCLGVSRVELAGLFGLEFTILGIAGGALGAVLGYAGHLVLLHALQGLIQERLPVASLLPAWFGVVAALVLLFGFALPPLAALTRVPPVHVLRREWGQAGRIAWLGYGIGIVLFAALLIAEAGEWRLGLIVAGGFALGLAGFAVCARLALLAFARYARGGRAGLGWRHASAALERRGASAALQITALALGLMCLLLIVVTRNDLVQGWRASLPADAPNQFLLDIQPDQRADVAQYLRAHGIAGVTLEPIVRARLIAVNGKPVDPGAYHSEQAKRLVDREFNLSYTNQLPDDNRIDKGVWYGAATAPQISLETGPAELLGLKLGDRLRFDVTGIEVEAPVTSLRKLDWNTFKVNFFVLMPPQALSDFPATYVTSFYLDPDRRAVLDGLIADFPGLTLIDVTPLLAQMARMLLQVVGAVQLLFAFTLAAGLLVLYAALAASREERLREIALMRALGASRAQVRAVQWAEFVVTGILAGAMAALGAYGIGLALATRVFDFPLAFDPWLVPAGIGAGVVCAALAGWFSVRRVLDQPALASLRDA